MFNHTHNNIKNSKNRSLRSLTFEEHHYLQEQSSKLKEFTKTSNLEAPIQAMTLTIKLEEARNHLEVQRDDFGRESSEM